MPNLSGNHARDIPVTFGENDAMTGLPITLALTALFLLLGVVKSYRARHKVLAAKIERMLPACLEAAQDETGLVKEARSLVGTIWGRTVTISFWEIDQQEVLFVVHREPKAPAATLGRRDFGSHIDPPSTTHVADAAVPEGFETTWELICDCVGAPEQSQLIALTESKTAGYSAGDFVLSVPLSEAIFEHLDDHVRKAVDEANAYDVTLVAAAEAARILATESALTQPERDRVTIIALRLFGTTPGYAGIARDALASEDTWVRLEGAIALRHSSREEAVETLIHVALGVDVRDSHGVTSNHLKRRALAALRRLVGGKTLLDVLGQILRKLPFEPVSNIAALELAKRRHEPSKHVFLSRIKRPNPADVRVGIECLMLLGDTSAEEHLVPLLAHSDAEVFAAVCNALGELGTTESIAAMQALGLPGERSAAIEQLIEQILERLVVEPDDGHLATAAKIESI